MSNHLITEVYKRQVGNIARKAVMVLLADKASDDGTGIWASKQRMADEIGATKQTVIATIKGLMADGLIREAGQRKCATGFTVEYAINVRALKALELVRCHADDQSENLTGQKSAPVKSADPTGQIPLPDQSKDLTQTLLNPTEPPKEEPNGSCPSDDERLTPEMVLEAWNELAADIGKPSVRSFTPERRAAVKARISQFTVDDFVTVFANIRSSQFLRDWGSMGFDWVMKKANFLKILEGNYNG